MEFLYRHGVTGFVAFNTLIFLRERERAVEQLEIMARAGVDAVIVPYLVRQLGALERLGVTKGTLERRREGVHR